LSKPLDHDEHQFVTSAALLAREGLVPYRDYPYHHLPYLTFAYAALFLTTDHLLLAARFLSVVFATAGILAVFVAARSCAPGRSAAERDAIAAAFAVVLVANPLFTFATARAWNHDASILCSLLAFLFMVRAAHAERALPLLFWSGVSAGIAIGIRSSFALLLPGFGLGVLCMRPPLRDLRASAAAAAAFVSGAAVALLPLVPLFFIAPDGFLHGNLRYNLTLNPAYRQAVGYDLAMTLPGKLAYFTDKVLVLRRNSFLLLTYLVCWLCLAGRTRRRYAFEQQLVLVLLPFLFLAALSATPSWYQYFYPLVPFVTLGVAYALADHAAMRLRAVGLAAVALLLLGSAAGLRHCAEEIHRDPGQAWPATTVHEIGTRIAELAGAGPVLTLAPILPLEGRVRIYPELATGPFAYRTAALVPAGEHARLHLAGPEDLESLVSATPPTAVLLGAEAGSDPMIEYAFVRYATEHGYQP
jgi:4-amino-4-deoxy-L-arabinose transferase-like glycosyltransferase